MEYAIIIDLEEQIFDCFVTDEDNSQRHNWKEANAHN